jgi:hypothetical protein
MPTHRLLIVSYHTPKIRTTLVVAGHVLTPLFSNVILPSNIFYKFFVPSLPPVAVVKAVITALDEQHSKTIYLPFYTNFAGWLVLVPSFVRDAAQWVCVYSVWFVYDVLIDLLMQLSGADYAMENFIKVSGRRPDEGPVPEGLGRKKTD